MTTRKQYNEDEVLKHLLRKMNVKPINGTLDISNANLLGNKSLGKIDYLAKKGWFITGTDKYKKKHNLLNEENNKGFSYKKRENLPIHDGSQQLELVYGEIPNFCNVGIANYEEFKKSPEAKKLLKKEKTLWNEAIESGKFQKKLVTIIKIIN